MLGDFGSPWGMRLLGALIEKSEEDLDATPDIPAGPGDARNSEAGSWGVGKDLEGIVRDLPPVRRGPDKADEEEDGFVDELFPITIVPLHEELWNTPGVKAVRAELAEKVIEQFTVAESVMAQAKAVAVPSGPGLMVPLDVQVYVAHTKFLKTS
jgi:hypothetical protein